MIKTAGGWLVVGLLRGSFGGSRAKEISINYQRLGMKRDAVATGKLRGCMLARLGARKIVG